MIKSMYVWLLPLALSAIPSGERVVLGDASIARPSSEQILVTQNSQQAVVEWDHFSLKTGETAFFKQPKSSSVILNRVIGNNPSEIFGQMKGNGRVFLVNPQGVLIGKTGRIDCASFLASTLHIENQSFLQENEVHFKEADGAKIINRGRVNAFGGPVLLIAPDIENTGEIQAKDQAVFMVNAKEVHIDSLDRPQVMIRPAATSHKHSSCVYALAVNGEEMIEASYVRKESGRVFLDTEPSPKQRIAKAAPFLTIPGTSSNTGISVEHSLDALQQLRTLIPDRLWEEEFAVLIDAKAFQDRAPELAQHPRLYPSQRSSVGLATSKYYFLHDAVSGEPIRLDDRYLEFLNSPYWKTPEALYRLYYLQHNYGKVPR